MSFFNELKRRNVFRVGVAYIVASWVILQVADLVFEAIKAPDWVLQALMSLVVLGFIAALIIAWAYEVTPEGIKRESEVDRSQSVTTETANKLNHITIGLLIAVAALVLVDRFVLDRGDESPAEPRLAAEPSPEDSTETPPAAQDDSRSIAVLPFVNMSSDPEQEFFSDGISEEILNALAKVDDLKVAGRTSSFAFKGQNQDLRRIGEALGVKHILEGSVRKAGNTVRITAQLIQVDDGFHLWSETFDRELTDVFAIQDEIAAAILDELKAELLAGESETMAATETDPQAYELYLLAKQRIYERRREPIEAAVAMLDRALEIDPDYAPALAQRGIATYLLQVKNYGTLTREQAEPMAKTYFDRALARDPNQAEALAGLGLYHSDRPREKQLGIETLEKALAINPNLINASNWLQQAYASVGEITKSRKILEDMFERDPLYPPGAGNLVMSYGQIGAFDQAWAVVSRVEPFLPGNPDLLDARARIFLTQGKYSSALPLIEQSLEQDPDSGTTMFGFGLSLLATHQYEKLLSMRMPPWMRIQALQTVGRTEEATLSAYERAAMGDIGPLFSLMNREGRPQDLVQYFNDRFSSIEQFDSEYPAGSLGNGNMLELAYAFLSTGDQDRFEEAMQRVRLHHDALKLEGIQLPIFLLLEAIYHAMAGNEDRALDELEAAIDGGMIMTTRIAWQAPALKPLEGKPRYEAIQQKMNEHLNEEREALGLEPVEP